MKRLLILGAGFLQSFVIKKAKELLKENTSMNNTDVAYALGFEYPNYFSKFFKKQVNLTPKEYRMQTNNGNL